MTDPSIYLSCTKKSPRGQRRTSAAPRRARVLHLTPNSASPAHSTYYGVPEIHNWLRGQDRTGGHITCPSSLLTCYCSCCRSSDFHSSRAQTGNENSSLVFSFCIIVAVLRSRKTCAELEKEEEEEPCHTHPPESAPDRRTPLLTSLRQSGSHSVSQSVSQTFMFVGDNNIALFFDARLLLTSLSHSQAQRGNDRPSCPATTRPPNHA